MNFVAQVEEQLRDLGTEARKKHPGVKEASERAILQLRTLQNRYVVAVRHASSSKSIPHPTTATFRSQDVLRPFLLAANYPDASFKILTIALNAIQLLLDGDAVCPDDGVHIVRILSIQGNVCCAGLSHAAGGGTVGGSGIGVVSGASGAMSNFLGSSIVTGFTGMLGGGGSKGNGYGHVGNEDEVGMGGGVGYSSSTGHAGHHSNRSWKEDEALSIRLLQTLTMVVDSRAMDLTQDILSQCFTVCLVLISAGGCLGNEGGVVTGHHSHKLGKPKGSADIGNVTGAGASSGGIIGSVRKVRRAAAATLRQIIAIVFDRASNTSFTPHHDEKTSDKNSTDGQKNGNVHKNSSSIRMVASQIFTDLCTLAEYRDDPYDIHNKSIASDRLSKDGSRNHSNKSTANKVKGPFIQALSGTGMGHQRLQPPPRSACFDLLEMILKQQVDLFSIPFPFDGARSSEQPINDDKQIDTDSTAPDFPSLLRDLVCPLLSNTLTSELIFGNDTSQSTAASSRSSPTKGLDTPTSFSSLLRSTQLALTIITIYGNNTVVHQNMPNATPVPNTEYFKSMKEECHVLLVCLIKFVTAATEVCRDSQEFEDGFVLTHPYGEASSFQDGNNPGSTGHAHHRRGNINNQSSNFSLISSHILWRAGISLECIYVLLSEHFETLVALHKSYKCRGASATLIATIMEAVSDFATVASSCKGNILNTVIASHTLAISSGTGALVSEENNAIDTEGAAPEPRIVVRSDTLSMQSLSDAVLEEVRIHPLVVARARDIIKSYDEWDFVDDNPFSMQRHASGTEKTSSKLKTSKYDGVGGGRLMEYSLNDSLTIPDCDSGEVVWVAFNCVLSYLQSLLIVLSRLNGQNGDTQIAADEEICVSTNREDIKSLIEGSFGSSLSVLQHFLKRFPASRIISRCTLSGYVCFANALIPLNEDHDMKRRALLASLCKSSLPSGGKGDSSWQLQDQHVAGFSALLQIIHCNYDNILGDWHNILGALEQLSCLSISSTKLSEEGYRAALSIAESFCRIASFTTCLSIDSIHLFISAAVTLSKSCTIEVQQKRLSESNSRINEETDDDGSKGSGSDSRESLGGKLIHFAGRAFSISGNTTSEEGVLDFEDVSLNRMRSSKTYGGDFRDSTYHKLARTKPTMQKGVLRILPFSLVLLTDLTIENSFRFASFSQLVTEHFCELAAKSSSSEIRLYVMDTLANLITLGLSTDARLQPGHTGRSLIERNPKSLDDFLRVRAVTDQGEGRLGGDSSLEEITREELLAPLCQTITITKQTDAAEAGLKSLHIILESAGHNMSGEAWIKIIEAVSALSGCFSDQNLIDRSSIEWANCSALAFRLLKLIVDDFLDDFPKSLDNSSKTTRSALLDCCASFGSSKHDVNTSLTATGMLWTIADQDPTPSSLDHVLSKLAFLTSDSRPEVRNCSVNTLFSCVVGLGHKFTSEQWENCLNSKIFGVLDQVASKGFTKEDNDKQKKEQQNAIEVKSSNRYKVTVHHSRDSSSKQWATTLVLTLRGLERVLRQFFNQLISTFLLKANNAGNNQIVKPETELDSITAQWWFESAWLRILDLAYKCSTQIGGRETIDVREAGVELLVLCSQVSSEAGIVAAATAARVGTNMQVVNGALRSVRAANSNTQSTSPLPFADDPGSMQVIKDCRQRLFLRAFETLEEFQIYLNDDKISEIEDNCAQSVFMETTLLQVLTKLSHGLSKLYECCKDYEMAPYVGNLDRTNDDTIEGRFVELVLTVTKTSSGVQGSNFLSQAQRSCLELLQRMASLSSQKAFVTLILLGGESFFWRQGSDDNGKNPSEESDPGTELLEYEAAKIVSESYLEKGVERVSKVYGMCMIIDKFCDLTSRFDLVHDVSTQYDLFVPIIRGGLSSIAFLEENNDEEDSSASNLNFDHIWSKIVTFLCFLVSTEGTPRKCFGSHTEPTLEILSNCIDNVSKRKYSELGVAFANGVEESLALVKFYSHQINPGEDKSAQRHIDDGLQIFKECFKGLCRCVPESKTFYSITEILLQDAAQAIENRGREMSNRISDFNVEVAIFVFQSLVGIPNISEVAIVIFPWLCKLVHSENGSLRREASKVLATIDLQKIITRNDLAEKKIQGLEDRTNAELLAVNKELEFERIRADNAELKVQELKKINKNMQEGLDTLKAEKEDLEQQLAVLSGGSAYI